MTEASTSEGFTGEGEVEEQMCFQSEGTTIVAKLCTG